MLQSAHRRVVITGMGVVSPNGNNVEAYAHSLAHGVSGLRWLNGESGAAPPALQTRIVGRVTDFDPSEVIGPAETRRVPRMVPLAIAASREALTRAHLQIDLQDIESQRSIGVALGTGGGGMAFVEDQYRVFFLEGKGSVFSITAGTPGNLSSELSIALHLRGPSHVLSTGCTSSTDAIGYAAMLIRNGIIPMMLAGGADSPISPGILTTFERMRVVSTRRWDHPSQASRPFSIDRDGFILAEGAWMFVLEEREHALSRGAPVLAELVGYASTCDAYHRVQIDPEVTEPVRAMELALQNANVAKDEIGYINLHGTSTELNDRLETAVVRKCFGHRSSSIPASSTKSMIGHPQGACGAAGLAATVLALRDGILHPTINLDHPDPACDLDYIPNKARQVRIDTAVCNCIAFGSKNSVLVIKRHFP
ncbi:MAG: beta-ketoacyl-[acyl-carrier-protein] synthase family protein [Bacillota bacterium]